MNKSKIALNHHKQTTDLMMKNFYLTIKINQIKNSGLINMIQKIILIFLLMRLKIGMSLLGSRAGTILFFLKKKSLIRYKSKNKKKKMVHFLKEIMFLNKSIKVGNNIINFNK